MARDDQGSAGGIVSDIVARLRGMAGRFGTTSMEARDLMREAADRIEQLEEEVA